MDIEGVMAAISTVGFPIAVAVWAMWMSRKDREWLENQFSVKLESITTSLNQMAAALDDVTDLLKGKK